MTNREKEELKEDIDEIVMGLLPLPLLPTNAFLVGLDLLRTKLVDYIEKHYQKIKIPNKPD